MDSSSYRHLAFLLSLGGIPLACTSDDTSSTSDTSPTGTTSGGTATTTGSASDTTTAGTDSGGSGSGTMGATSGSTSSGTTASETTGGPAGACESYTTKYVECNPGESYDDILAGCQEAKMYWEQEYGPACAAAFDALNGCLADQECADFPDSELCAADYAAFNEACAPEIGEVCAAFATKYAECSGEDASYFAKYCQIGLNEATMEYGAACGMAYEEYYACLTGLSCAELGGDNACPDEAAAIDVACGG
ncbi:MAG: hypothetical protein H6710_06815 [Myxococcales bacterium]|nr:hypothetical protein [Myxococcales bacterium]MCB9704642.1 hypothetical protein [Myxococcales bacterium]